MGLPRQEYWSGLFIIKPTSPVLQAALLLEPPVMPRKNLGRDIMWGIWQKFGGEDTGFTWKTNYMGPLLGGA